MYRRFGAAVTVVEMAPGLVSRKDEDISQTIREVLEREGIVIRVRPLLEPRAEVHAPRHVLLLSADSSRSG